MYSNAYLKDHSLSPGERSTAWCCCSLLVSNTYSGLKKGRGEIPLIAFCLFIPFHVLQHHDVGHMLFVPSNNSLITSSSKLLEFGYYILANTHIAARWIRQRQHGAGLKPIWTPFIKSRHMTIITHGGVVASVASCSLGELQWHLQTSQKTVNFSCKYFPSPHIILLFREKT